MIDFHNHMIPLVDDGAKGFESSIKMAEISIEQGVAIVVATPHYIPGAVTPTKHEIEDRLNTLRNMLKNKGLNLDLVYGHEVRFCNEIEQLLEDGLIATINNTRYLLVEFRRKLTNDDVIHELFVKGYRPIIAHAERCENIVQNPNLILDFIDSGALIQITAGSILGHFGRAAKKAAKALLKMDVVHFAGSDAHNYEGKRTPHLSEAYKKILKLVGKQKAEELFLGNAQKVLSDLDI